MKYIKTINLSSNSYNKAEQTKRMNLAKNTHNYFKLKQVEEFNELKELLKEREIDKAKVNKLADRLNEKGFTDKQIELALDY